MPNSELNVTEPVSDPARSDASAHHGRLSRRAFLGGGLGSAVPLLAIARGFQRSRRGINAQVDPGTPPASPAVGTPASPVAATPIVASPVASPTPVTGQLQVIDDQRPAYPGTPVDGGELRMTLSPGSNGVFNPASFRQDFQIMASYLDPLVWIDEVTMEPKPWLAESWNWTRDRTRLTIKLRDGVKWHDGSKFTAEDVVFSFYVYRDDVDSAVYKLFTNMDSAEVRDELTVVVRLNQPDGNWVLNASSQLIFQRAQYIDHWNATPEGQRTLNGYNWRKNDPIGTGPWIVGDRDDEQITFKRNDDYWAGPPHFEKLTLRATTKPEDRIAAWTSGKADIVWPISAADLPAVINSPGKLYVADAASVMFAAFNFQNPNRTYPALLSDLELRRALSMAIDRNRYAQQVFAGFAYPEKAGTIAQPWANDPESLNPPRDVEGAKRLLAKAGYRDIDGDGILESDTGDTLRLSVIVRNDVRDELIAILYSIVPDLAEIGVALQVRRLDADRFEREWIDTHGFDLVAYAYNLYPGFTDFDLYGSAWDIRQNVQGWNPGGYANREVDRVIRDLLVETDLQRQAELLKTLQRVTNEDLFGLWFGFPRDLVLVRPEIQGYQPNKMWQTWDTRKLWRT